MAERPWSTYQRLLDDLHQLCATERSGTLVCTTDLDAFATIVLHYGKIIALAFQGARGKAALPLLCTIQRQRSSFKEGMILRTEDDLPSTPVILQQLASGPSRQR